MPTAKTDANSQIALGANVASLLYGVNGAGLKIGIISDSFNNLNGQTADVASGDLPSNVTVLRDLASGGGDEGRAMTELAYKIAPQASFYFSSGYADPGSTTSSIQACANSVAALQAAGCNVIIDDLGFGTGEAFFQVGTVLDRAIAAAVASGVSYFSAAGNDGKAYYQQGFTSLSTSIANIGTTLVANDFGGGNPYLSLTVAAAAKMSALFEWAQPFASIGTSGASAHNSLAIYLLDAGGNVVASSITNQVGNDPTQSISFTNPNAIDTNYRLVVVQNGGTVPAGELFKVIFSNGNVTVNNPNANQGSGNIYGHELVGAQNSVAAVNYTNTPAFGVSPPVPTSFTSVGSGAILFDTQGNALATPQNAGEPNFGGAQGSGTAVTGFTVADGGFNGTSAAAPNVGAVSALVLQANGALTPGQMTSLLAQSAIPLRSTLPDTGAGLVQARAAVEIGADYKGASWSRAGGGDWSIAGSWSTNAAPVSTASAILDNNLGGFTASYTVTVTTAGDLAGSLAVAAPTGAATTLSVQSGGSLAVGGANATNITAGDFLVSNNGVLAVTGGTLSITGSLNSNNGTVNDLSGGVSANNFAQNAGSLTVGNGGAAATLNLTGGGLNETGGAISVGGSGDLTTTALADTASALSVSGGALRDSGSASFQNAFVTTAGTFTAASLADSGSTISISTTQGTLGVTGTASLTSDTLTTAGTFSAASALFTQAIVTDTGRITTTGTLSFIDTAATVAANAVITAGALVVGASLVGYTPTLTVGGQVTDAGNLSLGSAINGGTVIVQRTGRLIVGGSATDATILFSGAGVLDFTSSNSTLLTTQNTSTIGSLNTGGGTIDFGGLTYAAGATYRYTSTSGQLDILNASSTTLASVLLNKADNYQTFTIAKDAANGIQVTAACYCAGTKILTVRGEIAVESLAVGDLVVTRLGARLPVQWLGWREVDCARHPRPQDVWPVRIAAGAFGAGLPRRPLRLSPDHAVFTGGVLIPVRHLVNGATIVQEPAATASYWHVELPEHAILFAEGLTSESYLDTGNRCAFANGGGAVALQPDFALRVWEARSCARLVRQGAELVAARSRLLEIAGRLGHRLTQDGGLRVIAGGRGIAPSVGQDGRGLAFAVPPGARSVQLLSRRFADAEIRPESTDWRVLGVAVRRLWLDSAEIALDDPRLGGGWHAPEESFRWTDGAATLRMAGAANLQLELAVIGRYWEQPEPRAAIRA